MLWNHLFVCNLSLHKLNFQRKKRNNFITCLLIQLILFGFTNFCLARFVNNHLISYFITSKIRLPNRLQIDALKFLGQELMFLSF